MKRCRHFKLVEAGPSADVQRAVAEVKRRLRSHDVRALAVVLVMPGGQVATVFEGHRDGHFHNLNSGIGILRKRFDREAG
jgi:hypothetical protein